MSGYAQHSVNAMHSQQIMLMLTYCKSGRFRKKYGPHLRSRSWYNPIEPNSGAIIQQRRHSREFRDLSSISTVDVLLLVLAVLMSSRNTGNVLDLRLIA